MSTPVDDLGVAATDPYGRDVARSAVGLLALLNTGEIEGAAPDGVAAPLQVSAADVHVARRLGRLGGCEDEAVLAAVALTVRATRLGSVCLELGSLPAVLTEVADWPTLEQWPARLLGSPLVRAGDESHATPLVLAGDLLYLDRYWEQEGFLADEIRARLDGGPAVPDGLDASLAAYFPTTTAGIDYRDQRPAAEAACRGWLTVVTGGPGTGKTTTVARLLGVLLETDPELRIALAAPTGRAAARMGEAVADATRHDDFPATYRDRIAALPASTLHRLLGWLPGRRGFRHHQANKLPYDVVVVDESSMVSLTLMSQLLAAVRPQARLILVGDADQLASVDAGAVLGDLVAGLERVAPERVTKLGPSRRFGAAIGDLAAAIQAGDGERVVGLLTGAIAPAAEATPTGAVDAPDDATDGTPDGGRIELTARDAVDDLVLDHARVLREVAESGDAERALAVLDRHRLLCAHREGPAGAGYWNRRVERALALEQHRPGGLGPWYVGRPVIVTENDYALRLFNGDIGVVVVEREDDDDHDPTAALVARFADGTGAGSRHPVARLSEVQSAHAMTVHRSQGSQVDEVTVLLPEDDSQLLTRQLLYTAVTRAKQVVRVVGTREAVLAAVAHQALRASGLADRLRPTTT